MTDDADEGPDTDQLVQINQTRLDALMEAVDRLEHTVEDQAERIRELEQLVDPDPASTPYEQLTKDQKVNHIRRHLVEMGQAGNGKAAMQYREIKALFDGHPSPGHCYDLMRTAAALDGFQYDEGGSGNKRVRCDVAAVKDDRCFHAANKDRGAGAV